LTNGTVSDLAAPLTSSSIATDVIYGRTGVLYALSDNGLHVINLTVTPHAELTAQYVPAEGYPYDEKSGDLSSDKNTLYFVTGTCCSGYNSLNKYDVSAGLTKPALLKQTHLFGTGYMSGLRLHLIDDASVLLTTGAVYNTSNLTPKAKNSQTLSPAVNLPSRSFYVTLHNNDGVVADQLYFYDSVSSHQLSALSTGVVGTPGAIAATSNGNTIFVSSTGGMAKFAIGGTPPGAPVALPASQHQYHDLAIDLPRNRVYGTDASGRIDVIDMGTAAVVASYLLPAGANPRGIDLSPNGAELAVALRGLEKLLFIDPVNGATIAEVTPQLDDSIYYDNLPFDLIYGKTGRLYSSGNPGSGGIDYIHVIDTSTHTWLAKSPYPNTIRTDTEFVLNQSKTYLYANQTFSPNNIYIFNVQTDVVTELYKGPHGPVSAPEFTIVPDGSKIFTSTGQVWDSILQSQLGSLQGAPGKLIKYAPNQNLIILAAATGNGDILKFISPADYHLIGTYTPSPAGTIHEMEAAPDGSRLVININNGIKVINLDASVPSSLSVVSGSNQTAAPLTSFPLPFKAKLTNYLGQTLSGKTVTFTAPASGASGKFANTQTNLSTAVTDANGIATSATFTANNLGGGYTVAATVSGLAGSASFQLFNGTPKVKTFTANNSYNLPGSLLCDQNQPNCTNGSNLHADAAHKYTLGTYNLYAIQHKRNSIDNQNMVLLSTVHYGQGYANAFWNGTQMVYGDGYGFPLADDVVAHELTHGVTEHESQLFYYYQSGAINESFSDLWGEYYDQTNGLGNDSTGAKWQMGEDVSGLGAIRYMDHPEYFGDPDRITSYYYYTGEGDNGGVHSNSGVNNKAVFLMVDGGNFNGKTITGLGWTKTAAIYYEVNSKLLSSGADYADLYYALQKACTNLIGQKGITAGDCAEVKDAVDAVEMNKQPVPNFNIDAPVCDGNSVPKIILADDLEAGTANWTFQNGNYLRWQRDSSYFGPYAQSGLHSLYADDYPGTITDAKAKLKPVTLPANAYLHFAQAYHFESYSSYYYDGGVLEYTTNNGATWIDAGPLLQFNGYKGAIYNGAGNPLSGRNAFVGASHGYIGTRVNLASLAGKTVSFRWRMGLDVYASALGWWVDNVKIYTCTPPPGAFNKINPSNGVTGVGLNPALTWSNSAFASSYQYCYDTINDNKCNRTWLTVTDPFVGITNIGTNTTYYWQVRAINSVGTREADNQSWSSFSTTSTIPAGNARIETLIGTTQYGAYTLGSGQSLRESYSGGNNGPAKIYSTNNIPLLGAERVIYKVNGANTSYSELMGLPGGALDTTYWLPWYNNVDLDSQLRFANVSGSTATVDVTIGGQPVAGSPFTLLPGESTRQSFTGISDGPVKIQSNVNIVATERVIYKVNNVNTSFSEMMALPEGQLDTDYWLPYYNNVDLDTQLRFANVSDTEATVDVTIGGQPVAGSPFTLLPGESTRQSFTGISDGPVHIHSNVNIVASERLIFKVNNTPTSFTEMMALPANQLSNTYWLPWYNNVDLDSQLRFANAGVADTTVHIYVGGTEIGTGFNLPVGASSRVSFPNVSNGPVQLVSDQPIVASERVIYKVNNVNTSFSEMMGLPDAARSPIYWFPWYNNVDLDTQLRFGVP
jgi:hypothetical protein